MNRDISEERDHEKAAELTKLAIEALDSKKAVDIRIIDIREVSVLADYFVIAEGTNPVQIQTLSDAVAEKLQKAGRVPKQIEGYQNANWILMDFGDVIVHIFDGENRLLYDLERIWKDGRQIDPADL